MAITTGLCDVFKAEVMRGAHNMTNSTGHTYKMALFKASVAGTFSSSATDSYDDMSTDEHATGNGYTTGGFTLTNTTPIVNATKGCADFNDPSWNASGSGMSTDGCLLYNDTTTTPTNNPACFVYSFGSTQNVTSGGTLTLVMPAQDGSNAIIRIGT
jgi:hypothetical protein